MNVQYKRENISRQNNKLTGHHVENTGATKNMAAKTNL
jgi:hypothetical protein